MTPSWILTVPFRTYAFGGGAITRAANVQASESGPNLLTIDAPTVMTEWELTAINLMAFVQGHTAGAEAPEPSAGTLVAQLLIGGDVVWSSAPQEAPGVRALKFSQTPVMTFAENFNNPLALPRGRTLQIRFVASVSYESDQLVVGLLGPETVPGGLSTIAYNVRQLSGRREL